MNELEQMQRVGGASADDAVINDAWSVLSADKPVPEMDFERLHDYRIGRLKAEMRKADVAMLVLINPSSLRYAADYESYQLFQAHMPGAYMFCRSTVQLSCTALTAGWRTGVFRTDRGDRSLFLTPVPSNPKPRVFSPTMPFVSSRRLAVTTVASRLNLSNRARPRR